MAQPIEIFVEAPNTIAYVSYGDIYAAAKSVFQDCTENSDEHTGGIAGGLAAFKTGTIYKPLAVVVQASDSSAVNCDSQADPGPEAESCKNVVEFMPAGLKKEMFAFAGLPEAEVKLPAVYHSSDRGCYVTTRSPDWNPDYGRWYDIWKAASLIYTKCVVTRGKSGSLGGQGELGHLEVVLTEQSLPDNSLTSTH